MKKNNIIYRTVVLFFILIGSLGATEALTARQTDPVPFDAVVHVAPNSMSYIYPAFYVDFGGANELDYELEIVEEPEFGRIEFFSWDVRVFGNRKIYQYRYYQDVVEPGPTDTFTFRVTGPDGYESDAATITLHIVEDATTPQKIANPPSFVGGGTELHFDINDYFISPVGLDISTIRLFWDGEGALTDHENGSFVYQHPVPLPDPPEVTRGFSNYFKFEAFVALQDQDGLFAEALFAETFITHLMNDSLQVPENGSITKDVFENYEALNDSLGGDVPIYEDGIFIYRDPQKGSVEIVEGNPRFITYTPDPGESGEDDFLISFLTPFGAPVPGVVIRVVAEITEPGNQPPQFISEPVSVATALQEYVYEIEVTDPNGDAVAITAPVIPFWLFLTDNGDGTAVLSGTPQIDDVGPHNVTLRASDSEDTTDQEFVIEVPAPKPAAGDFTVNAGSNTTSNIYPVLHGSSATYASGELEFVILTDGNFGTAFSADITIESFAFPIFRYTHTDPSGSTDSFTYKVVDPDGFESDPATVTVIIIDGAVPPQFQNSGPQFVGGGISYEYDITHYLFTPGSIDNNTVQAFGNFDGTLDINTAAGIITYHHPEPLPDPAGPTASFDDYFTFRPIIIAQDTLGLYSSAVTLETTYTRFINAELAVAGNQSVTANVFENYDQINTLLGSDFPVNEDEIFLFSEPEKGVVEINSENPKVITYTPENGVTGDDSFLMAFRDFNGASGPRAVFRVDVEITEPANQPPFFTVTFDEETITEGDEFQFQFEAEDPDGDDPAFSLMEGDDVENASITVNGLFTFHPEVGQAGDYLFEISVSDGELVAGHPFSITVESLNRPPVFETSPVTEANILEEYRYEIHVSEPDGDPVTILAPTLPVWLTFTDNEDGTALLAGTPAETDLGDHAVVLLASDGENETLQEFTVRVSEEPNQPPLFTTTFDEAATAEGDEFSFQFEAGGANIDELIFSLTQNGDVENVFMTDDGLFTFSPDFGQAGEYDFTVQVSDGELTDEHDFKVIVEFTNRPPEFTTTFSQQTMAEGDTLTFQFEAEDPDGDDLIFFLESGGETENASLTETGFFTFEPDFGQADEHSFLIRVSDGDLSDDHEFSIIVTSTNRPPVLTVVFDEETIGEGDLFSFQFQAEDPDGGDVLFALIEGGETENVLFTGEGLFTFEPDFGQAGEYEFTVEVSDGDLTDQHSFTIIVEQTNRPPVAEDVSASTRINVPITIRLMDFVSGPDGDALEITEISSPQNGQAALSQGTVTYTPGLNFTGSDSFTYTVGDAEGATDTGQITVEVLGLAYAIAEFGLPDGSESRAFDISDQGHVVGVFSGSSGSAFLWFNGAFQPISSLSHAFSVNNSGVVAGMAEEFGNVLPATFSGGNRQLGGTLGGQFGILYDINNNGMGAGTSEESDGRVNGFIWNNTALEVRQADGADIQLYAINDNGEAAGFIQFSNTDDQPVLFSPDGSFQVLSSGPDTNGRVFGMGNNGHMAGVTHSSGAIRGAAWQNGIHRVLPGLSGSSSTIAYDVNDGGVAVGSSAAGQQKIHAGSLDFFTGLEVHKRPEPSKSAASSLTESAGLAAQEGLQAVLWLDDDVVNLNELLPADSGWQLVEARAINNHMDVVGFGLHNGTVKAFLITPSEVDDPVAESSSHNVMAGAQTEVDLSGFITGRYGSLHITDMWGAKFGSTELKGNSLLNYQAASSAAVDTVFYRTVDGRGAIAEGQVIFNISELPDMYELFQNYPNPFNNSTIIPFQLAGPGRVIIELFSVDGRRVATVFEQDLPAGAHRAEVRNLALSSGVYFYRMRVTNASGQAATVLSRKMVLLK